MEGAVESGKIVSKLISDKYKKGDIVLYNHDNDPFIIKAFQFLDNMLYYFYLPNLIDTTTTTILIFVVILILTLNAKKWKKS